MRNRMILQVNAGSMADIAFLLLIFFLVTTTMDSEIGIQRKLPPDISNYKPPIIKERNIMEILVNKNNELMVEGNKMPINKLREFSKIFIENPQNNSKLPEKEWVKFKEFGHLLVTKYHIISVKSDRSTSYGIYLAVQNEIVAAYNELRDQFSLNHFNCSYHDLDISKKITIDSVYPLKISEAEPVNVN